MRHPGGLDPSPKHRDEGGARPEGGREAPATHGPGRGGSGAARGCTPGGTSGLGKDRVETLALIRHLLRSDPLEAIAPWLRIAPKHLEISRVVSSVQKY